MDKALRKMYEDKQVFVAKKLCPLLKSLDSEVLGASYHYIEYDESVGEEVTVIRGDGISHLNVAGMSDLEITLNVLSDLFHKNPRCRIQHISVDGLVYDLKALKGRLNGVGNDIDRLLHDIGEVTPL